MFEGKIELVNCKDIVSPHLKYRPGLLSWKVYHKGKGKMHPPVWHLSYESVPEWKRSVLKPTMFSEEYTLKNNKFANHLDPLNLMRCMRLYPQDDN